MGKRGPSRKLRKEKPNVLGIQKKISKPESKPLDGMDVERAIAETPSSDGKPAVVLQNVGMTIGKLKKMHAFEKNQLKREVGEMQRLKWVTTSIFYKPGHRRALVSTYIPYQC